MISKRNKVLFYFSAALIILTTSCASNLTMQTAKVLPEGVISTGGAVAISPNGRELISQYSDKPDKYEQDYKNDYNGESVERPTVNPWFMMKYGLGGSCDIGLNISPNALEGDFKYQAINYENLFLALGIISHYGYAPDVSDDEPGIHSFDIILPLYISYDFTSRYAVYGAGKYIIRNIYSKRDDVYTVDSPRYLVSGTLGNKIKYTDSDSVLFELCVNKDLGINFYSAQFNVGATQEY